jgi:hypothetical protein
MFKLAVLIYVLPSILGIKFHTHIKQWKIIMYFLNFMFMDRIMEDNSAVCDWTCMQLCVRAVAVEIFDIPILLFFLTVA